MVAVVDMEAPEARRVLREFDDDIYNGYGFDYEHPPEIRDLDLLALDEDTLLNSPEARRALREFNDIYNDYDFDYEHPPEIWNDLHMDGDDNEVVVVEPDVIAEPEAAEPNTTPRHRVVASIGQYDITSDGGNEASSNIGSRVSDGSDSPLFSDPVDESTSPSGLYTLDPYQANPQEQQLAATIRGGSGNEIMEDENLDIDIQAAAAENQGSALLSHIEDEVPDRPTPPATDNPSSPSERTKRRRTGVFGCMSSTLASPVSSAARAARSIARHSGSAARSAASATSSRVSSAASAVRHGLQGSTGDDIRFDDRLFTHIENEDVRIVDDDDDDDSSQYEIADGSAGDVSEGLSNIRCEYETLSDTMQQEDVITPDGDAFTSTMFGNGRFAGDHMRLMRALQSGELEDDDSSMRKAVAEFIQYANNMEQQINSGVYNNAKKSVIKQLQTDFNNKRDGIITAMKLVLPEKFHHLINMANPFSHETVIMFILHYAPVGVRHAKDKHDFTRDDQCCIHTMKKKLYNFLVNDNAGLNMKDYNYGGRTNKDMSSQMVVVDMIPMLLEKFDKEADMILQYQKYTDLLKLDSFYELMAISQTTARLHLLLHRVSHPDGKKCQVHVASSAAAKHMFGLAAGPAKYFAKIAHSSFTITFGPHPQESIVHSRLLVIVSSVY